MMDPSAQEFHPESAGYPCGPCMMQPQVISMVDIATLQMLDASKWGTPVMLAGLMGSSMMEAQFTQAAPNKAMQIKSPTTGEVLNPETLKVERQTSQSSGSQDPIPPGEGSAAEASEDATADTAKVKAFDARARAEFKATAALASSRLRSMKLRPDHSTFSALNVDILPSKPKSSPLASTCEGGNIILRPCRPLKAEKPKSHLSRPLPEVPGSPFDKVPASAAQMLAVLSLEPGIGKVSKSKELNKSSKVQSKVRSAAALKRAWQPELAKAEEKKDASEKLSTTATDSHGSDMEQDPSSGSGEAVETPCADAADLKKGASSDDDDGKASAERSTSAASLECQEERQASSKTRWADVESDDEGCPWQSQTPSSNQCKDDGYDSKMRAPKQEEETQARRQVSQESFSKTRWADVDSDDDQLMPSEEEEGHDGKESDFVAVSEEKAEPVKRERRPRSVKPGVRRSEERSSHTAETQEEAAPASAPVAEDKSESASGSDETDTDEQKEQQASAKTRWADVDSDDDQLLPSEADSREKDKDSEEEEWQEVKRERKPKAMKQEVSRPANDRPRERRDDRRRKDAGKEADSQAPRRKRDGERNERDGRRRPGGGENRQENPRRRSEEAVPKQKEQRARQPRKDSNGEHRKPADKEGRKSNEEAGKLRTANRRSSNNDRAGRNQGAKAEEWFNNRMSAAA